MITIQKLFEKDYMIKSGLVSNRDELLKLDISYNKISSKIRIINTFTTNGGTMVHLSIPSETATTTSYDVVVQFTGSEKLIDCPVKFFSNSPSFVYRYTYVYNENDLLIKEFIIKLGNEFVLDAPEKSNKDLKLKLDKSLYSACKYIYMNKTYIFNPINIRIKNVSKKKFLDSISDLDFTMTSIEIDKMDKSIKKTVKTDNLKKEKDIRPSKTATSKGVRVKRPKGKIKPRAKISKKR